MLPINFLEKNDNIGNIPICRKTIGYIPVMITKWQLSKEDLEEIQRTGIIWVTSIGVSFQPITLSTDNPFEEKEK